MQLEHSFTVPVGVEDAWSVLLDIERIAPCMPGAAITSVDGDDFTGTVKVKLGPISLTYKGKASFIEKDATAHRAVIDARGRDSRGSGTANAKVTATLTQADASTEVHVVTDLDITGKPAQFGRGVMVDVGNKLIGQFADCLAGQLTAGGDNAAAVPADTVPADTAQTDTAQTDTAPEPPDAAGPPSEQTAPKVTIGRHAAPSDNGAAPAADRPAAPAMQSAGAARPSAPTAARRPPVAEVEPINLIESAGPALLKRLAPVAAVVLAVLLVVMRRRRRG